MKSFGSLLLFLVLVLGAGIAIGILTAPGEWYGNLQKPFFNPPNWVFGPVWTVLYLMIAYVGWRAWRHESRASLLPLWIAQLSLNFSWSPVFFAAQKPALALVIILCLLLTIAVFIRTAWQSDRPSALLFAPYIAWVGFASALNAAIVFLN
ncbi:TspO/MBR family protein [Aliiroseovarius sp. F20344]|uniref:TspO/MBR family protein n=1 Tax=Aliiroseovarius sp. F20344 TaxID=2926414 RepID=UPI001FF3F149|nr:TspO/MBR family protein [Aliiroseovarius sp. F20344]MCK0142795.1 tryptophan-rich sensory protein [Aliiroseovarius sp. F20344]